MLKLLSHFWYLSVTLEDLDALLQACDKAQPLSVIAKKTKKKKRRKGNYDSDDSEGSSTNEDNDERDDSVSSNGSTSTPRATSCKAMQKHKAK